MTGNAQSCLMQFSQMLTGQISLVAGLWPVRNYSRMIHRIRKRGKAGIPSRAWTVSMASPAAVIVTQFNIHRAGKPPDSLIQPGSTLMTQQVNEKNPPRPM